VVTFGVMTGDLSAHTVSKAETGIVKLMPTEWHFLQVLMRNTKRLVTKHFVFTTVWGLVYETGGGSLPLSLGQLLKKLESEPSQQWFLPTEPGWVIVSCLGVTGATRSAWRLRLGSTHLVISCHVCRSSQHSDVPKSAVPACRRPSLPRWR